MADRILPVLVSALLAAGAGGAEQREAVAEAAASQPAGGAGAEGDGWPEGQWAEEDWEEEGQSIRDVLDQLPFELKGFVDLRGGLFTQHTPHLRRDASLGEVRLQLHAAKDLTDWARVTVKADSLYDGVTDDTAWELREGNVALTLPEPFSQFDVKLGRQILTWGVGDLIFINDLFPKNWESFFLGRDEEYLKDPSDALRVSLFGSLANAELVYVPQFDPDTYIDGKRVSYWSNALGRRAGQDAPVGRERPDRYFREDEFHLRVFRTAGSYELALYGYWGRWKSPGGSNPLTGKATFPRLHVYGASVRGPVLSGIGKAEVGYYDSREDRSGKEVWVNNSELRFLVGYERELAEKFTGAIQYYVEYMVNHDKYRRTLPAGMRGRDEDRHVITLRLTKLLMQENLILSLFCYVSPSDEDAYLRPNVRYKFTDNLRGELGGNVFARSKRHTFFGQFGEVTSVYAAVRYSF